MGGIMIPRPMPAAGIAVRGTFLLSGSFWRGILLFVFVGLGHLMIILVLTRIATGVTRFRMICSLSQTRHLARFVKSYPAHLRPCDGIPEVGHMFENRENS
jgi:Flp pilus assembly protein TadB